MISTDFVTELSPVMPEVFLAVSIMVLLLSGVFVKKNPAIWQCWAGVVILLATFMVLMCWNDTAGKVYSFNGLFVLDGFAVFVKSLVLLASAVALVLAAPWLAVKKFIRFEYAIFVLFAVLGMMALISANDLISLYLALELQSLSLYLLAAYKRRATRSSEAGVKYYVLGALGSGLFLYGATLVYGFTGTTSFSILASELNVMLAAQHFGFITGILFMLAGIAFKMGLVPFHMWVPDVYQGAPTPVTAFFSTAPKVAAFALAMRLLSIPFATMGDVWQPALTVMAVASMLVGAFGAMKQTNIKRMLAYSAIGHAGYAAIGLIVGTPEGLRAALVYLSIYVVMSLGAFAVLLSMRRAGDLCNNISDMAGAARTNPALALAMAVFMFSMAGIPPLAGFFGKLYVFMAALEAGYIALAVIGVLSSVVAAFYYLRIVKLMYFDDSHDAFEKACFSQNLVVFVCAILIVGFFALPTPLLDMGTKAASALLSM